jgi:hypothetical protein
MVRRDIAALLRKPMVARGKRHRAMCNALWSAPVSPDIARLLRQELTWFLFLPAKNSRS